MESNAIKNKLKFQKMKTYSFEKHQQSAIPLYCLHMMQNYFALYAN